jgi:hypothetical protein
LAKDLALRRLATRKMVSTSDATFINCVTKEEDRRGDDTPPK